MKRRILATLIPALLITTPSYAAEIYNKDGNKLDLYGKVKALHYFSDYAKNDGDKSYVRFGFKGVTSITDELSGYGQWEYNIAANYAESQETKDNKTRLGFAGLRYGKLGSIDYGRNYGVLYDIAAWTDMLPEFGNDSYTRTDNFMTGRATGVATYRNADFFGLVNDLKFTLQYQGKNGGEGESNNARSDVTKQNGDGFGLSSSYEIGAGMSIGAAYSSSNRTLAQKNSTFGKGDKADAWTTGFKYNDNGVYIGVTYAETRNMTPISGTAVINNLSTGVSGFANKTQNIELVAQYLFDFGLRPSIAYIQSKGKDIEGIGDTDLVKYVDIGASYYFNKNMSTYVDYRINQLNDNNSNKLKLNTDDIVAVGLVYQF